MTTELRKEISRRTVEVYDHHDRRIVVSLVPGDCISMREERTRRLYVASIHRVYQAMIVWSVEAERANKKKRS